MSTGDVGHFDKNGLLFVDGRDDEMIVSGGENVFPGEIETLLSAHEAIDEAAAIGVDDEAFGTRLRVFVVLQPGKELDAKSVKDYVRANLARYKVPQTSCSLTICHATRRARSSSTRELSVPEPSP